jgi:electron transport complex protein RnfD
VTGPAKTLQIRSSPHLASGHRVDQIMFHVVLALLPTVGFAIWAFGLPALLVLATAVLSCVITEHALCRLTGRQSTVRDWSVVITGLLYGLTLPPGLPLWMVAAGSVIAVGLGKFLFGGLGYNPFNPALVGRAVLQAAFPVPMTTWLDAFTDGRFTSVPASTLALPFLAPDYDGVSTATPLTAWKFDAQPTAGDELLLGLTSGSVGETCAVLILLGGVYLALRNMMNWRIPVAILATVALFSGILWLTAPDRYASPMFMLLSGGLMLGAVFMATDMVASPMTHRGAIVYGGLIGVLVVVIRVWGGMPEGVMYSILLANAAAPHIDGLIRPRVYGTAQRARKAS